ncbi:TPA: hypothetical protein ACX6QN_003725 [Photobacterium damselae]
MTIEFFILNIIFVLNLIIFTSFKQYKTSGFIWFICYFTLFVSPSYYITFGGDGYSFYTDYGVAKYYITGSIYGMFIMVFILFKGKDENHIHYSLSKTKDISNYTLIYVLFIFTLVLGYVVFYFKDMPFYSILIGQSFIRPDTLHNGIKFYFTFSVLMDVICPSLYFLLRNKIKNKFIDVLFLLLISFLLIVGGSKGTLVYFFIFYWFSILDLKLSKRFFVLLLFSFIVYFFIKGMLFSNVSELFEGLISPLRRFFVTQGIAIPIRFDMDHYNVFYNIQYQNIKFVVFEYVYGYEPGSMPVIFFPDLIIKFGFLIASIVLFIFFFVLFFISRIVDKSESYFCHWMFYILSFSVLMSGFSDANLYRIIAAILNVYIVFILSKNKVENANINNNAVI